MSELRLGDVIDDYCVKCRRLTNHAIVSIVNSEAAKVRCRTCYHDHDYRHEEAPPSKKDLKKAELFAQVLAGQAAGAEVAETAETVETADPADPAEPAEEPAVEMAEQAVGAAEEEAPKKKAKKTAKK
jgi:hypothetical protein